ncbi:serine/threonine-protein kinase [Aphanizomenon flos-aquae NRERC-008]|jgi:serine/threonine protein kinase|uniref:non-specific serine/threonine protein kinase n=2 Tax=Aphanizomenon flos-aquae TaxID=1176 RepID=A0A1B7WYC2_APHFL|nr:MULTISPECIES: serine/threonine-protein kinase [Aphanizomenon]MCE2904890.1 serine/threonine protein kinase [Anabaena sp. CoA2_C59]MDJ0503700.1 serine/threonine-protein kinase [Nostocales cyanobacterium LE14-WE12]OBQ42121.1 MAG: serine/threonine protein kinase [Aphanizomenon flos-aquae WA102]MBD2389173.1 serine/threonine protein kinase [Aphanizomenon flos-aquae FACHB-1171]MBD2556267.1 serine/threonine protein kinase [Aphanizomenon flos-aquae FACHB-1290]
MEVFCTRPHCQHPQNHFPDLDDIKTLKTVPQKFCTNCGMPLILRDRYLPIKLLATGGFGAAFLAIDRDTPRMRQCVVKQFQPSGNLTEEALEKSRILFTQEAGVLEEIGNEHQQIPKLFAFFTITVPNLKINKSEQFFYLVQEYISGQTLEEELAKQGNFSELKILKILREILPVLQFIHDKGIIHRDIKPSNIIRHYDGRLFLLDFGAVKLIANTSSSSTGIYSLGFAPPEQMQGNQVFPSTDLYALAVTLITLLTGKEANKLFDAYTNQWQWRSQISVNPRLAAILDKMLLSAANQRFQSAQEVLEALFPAPSAQTVLPPTQPPNLQPPQPIKSVQPAFTIWELLAGAAFSGFEAALIAIALFSLVKNPIITLTVAAVILNGLIFAQTKRWLEKFDLLIIPAVSFAIIFFIPFLRSNIAIEQVIILAIVAALISISVTALFRLVYKLMSSIL